MKYVLKKEEISFVLINAELMLVKPFCFTIRSTVVFASVEKTLVYQVRYIYRSLSKDRIILYGTINTVPQI